MEQGLQDELDALEEAVGQLAGRIAERERQATVLVQRVAELEEALTTAQEAAERDRTVGAVRQAALAFGPDSEDARTARKLIDQLLKEIENCIALLRG